MQKEITILAIESSCDETAAAVVRNGREVLSNVIYSQIDLHTLYGGVVPEIASRKHIEKVNQVIEEALRQSGRKLEEMEAIAVTYYVSAYQQMRTEGFVGAKSYITTGNKLTEKTLSNSVPVKNEISGLAYNTIPYLINMDVWASDAESIVFIGDSTLANDIPALVAQKLVG